MERNDEQTNVRLPKDLKEWLCQQAEDNRRSLTAEVTFRLEDSRQRQLGAQKEVKPQQGESC